MASALSSGSFGLARSDSLFLSLDLPLPRCRQGNSELALATTPAASVPSNKPSTYHAHACLRHALTRFSLPPLPFFHNKTTTSSFRLKTTRPREVRTAAADRATITRTRMVRITTATITEVLTTTTARGPTPTPHQKNNRVQLRVPRNRQPKNSPRT